MEHGAVTERALDEADLPAVRALVQRCLDADGGLPMASGEWFVRRRYSGGPGIALTDESGRLVAAAALGPAGDDGRPASGVVDPAWRGRGLGRRLLAWSLDTAGGVPIVAAAENLTDGAERLYGRFGLVPIFGELIMRCPLPPTDPPIDRPAGVTFAPWTDDLAAAFFAAYSAAFADRPGFPAPPQERWIADTAEDDGFRPGLCLLARDANTRPIGFLTVAQNWIAQTGVVPEWRRRRLATAMISATLAALAADGETECLLTVATDNPGAEALYRRIGFEVTGRRARYAAPSTGRQEA